MNKYYHERKNCVICNNIIVETYFLNDKKLPITTNFIDKNENCVIIPYNILKCNYCNCYQNKYLGKIELVYNENHNNIVISKIWENNYESFFNFIIKSNINLKNDNTILEIGAGNNYIVNLFKKNSFNNYTIIEPIITNKIEDVKYITGWLEDTEINETFDLIILSHVLEHLYIPDDLFKIKSKFIAINIPNIPKYLDDNILNFLNIEHIYYFEEEHIEFLFKKNNYKKIAKDYYLDHSIFMIFEYDDKNNQDNNYLINICKNKNIDNRFNLFFNNINKLIVYINNILINNKDVKYAVFPGNLYIQYLIMLGLNLDSVEFLYDNNTSKKDKFLYGTHLICKNIDFFIENNDYVIILLGFIYNYEVKKTLDKYNIKYIEYNIT
jgi:hypothetical protein